MRGKSTTEGRCGSSTPPARDIDLLDTDQFLSNEELDELWDWFFAASAEGMDAELVFVKLINSARNPYRHNIPQGYQPLARAQDLISLDQEDEVDQLKHLVTSLRAEIAVKDEHITSLEAKDEHYRESEKQLIRQIAEKEREIEKRDERLQILEENEKSFDSQLAELKQVSLQQKESLERQRKEAELLQQKRDELIELMENLNKEQLNNGELYRQVLQNKELELERWKQQSTLDESKQKQIEEELAAREKELQEMGNDYGRRLAEKEKELETKLAAIDELRVTIDGHEERLKQKLGECETKHMESRRDLISTVCTALSKKSLTPVSIGLQDEEWTGQKPSRLPAIRPPWLWRS
ncbi:hypothetical protein L211DRAFT_474815 [Terfezia boudieri ATCC MYA-4762]|uniref:Uncharacterized protein n=1 Tax=Terfezia boudieri ATCC MYA-4762 TaxID=1051890 RepID=A0A3N4LYH4_9PEZI|nr:hypothetical protein L211DRAFT_474815 [Terfezia boudieri ATCC MYA-4762]